MKYEKWLVVKANGDMRIKNSDRRQLAADEVAYPLIVDMPDAWGEVAAETITLKMPDPPTVTQNKP